jgi:hypothetical protein
MSSSRVPAWKVASLVPTYRSVGVESMAAPGEGSASVELGLNGKPVASAGIPGGLPLAGWTPKDIVATASGFVAADRETLSIDPLGKPTLRVTGVTSKAMGSPTMPESDWTPSPQPVPSTTSTV